MDDRFVILSHEMELGRYSIAAEMDGKAHLSGAACAKLGADIDAQRHPVVVHVSAVGRLLAELNRQELCVGRRDPLHGRHR